MTTPLRDAFAEEIELARDELHDGRLDAASAHLARAHALGQGAALLHIRAHAGMAGIALRRRDWREVLRQLGRALLAGPASLLGRLTADPPAPRGISALR